MLSRCLMIIGVFIITSVMLSCRTTQLDRNWGRSFEAAKFGQIQNPETGKNLDPVLGLDGQAAEYSVDNYKKAFREKETQEITNIIKVR